jgi:SAM-dependent methyltransferase
LQKIILDGRIAYIGKEADSFFWTEIWDDASFEQKCLAATGDKIINSALDKYLKTHDQIIEAGCGLGQWVYVLTKKGFNIIGIDNYKEIIDKMPKNYDLNIKFGNVLDLDFPDSAFDSYISFGVAEHFKEGPQLLLREAARVLKPGGILFISVPQINYLRKLKKIMGLYKKQKSFSHISPFYQYIFDKNEFTNILRQNDFVVLEFFSFAALQGLADEFLFAWKGTYKEGSKKASLKSFFKSKRLFESKLFRVFFGHMILFVAKKT